MSRVCAYVECDRSMDDRDPDAEYCCGRHRTAQWKLDTSYVHPGARNAGNASQAPRPRRRQRPKSATPRPSGLAVGYQRVLTTLTDELQRLGHRTPRARAEQILRRALTDRQQKRLDQINAKNRTP